MYLSLSIYAVLVDGVRALGLVYNVKHNKENIHKVQVRLD